jgi:hypothetical protein
VTDADFGYLVPGGLNLSADGFQGFVSRLGRIELVTNKFVDTKHENSLDIITKYRPTLQMISNTTLSSISIQVFDSSGKEFGRFQNTTNTSNLLSVDLNEITQLGTYRFEAYNTGSEQVKVVMDLKVEREQIQKPMFYYGLAGLVAALTYGVITLRVLAGRSISFEKITSRLISYVEKQFP